MSKNDISTRTVVTLKKKRTQFLISVLVAAAAGFAIAASAGKYYCGECTFDEPAAFGETEAFIRSEVNKNISSWVDSKGNPLDVTICNGSQCATYKYVKLSSIFIFQSKENSDLTGDNTVGGGSGTGDSGGGGSNGGGGGGSGPIGGCYGKCNGEVTVGA